MSRQDWINQANKWEKIMKQNKGLTEKEMKKFNKAKINFTRFIKLLDISWKEWSQLSTN
jgi:hypothetical protein